jgi:hypothetical protein
MTQQRSMFSVAKILNYFCVFFISVILFLAWLNLKTVYLLRDENYAHDQVLGSDSAPSPWYMKSLEVYSEYSFLMGLSELIIGVLLLYILYYGLRYKHILSILICSLVLCYEFFNFTEGLP